MDCSSTGSFLFLHRTPQSCPMAILPQKSAPPYSFRKYKTAWDALLGLQTLASDQQLIFDQMTSKRQRGAGSQRSCPNSAQRIDQTPVKGYNPEFQQLSSKSLTLPSRPRGETHAPTPDSIRAALLHALEEYFNGQFSDFEGVCRGWVLGQWKDTRLNLQSRLSKINYLSPTLIFESFGTVEREIRLEWKKSHLLKGLTFLWAHSFRKRNFGTLQEAKDFYEGFCHTFTIVTWALFGVCLAAFEEKGIDVGEKLLRNTAVGFVTELKEWKEIYCNKLQPLLLCESTPFSENFHIGSIEINPRIFDVKSPCHNFPQTAKNLSSLIKSLTIDESTTHLQSFRSSLLKEIEESINWSSNGGKQPTVQKDDVLSCIIYVLVSHQLDAVGSFLAYLSFLLGKDIDAVLRSRKVDCFRADLEAAYWIVSQPVVKLDYSKMTSDEVC